MNDARNMYELEYPSPEVPANSAEGNTLIIALQGYADAGHAVEGAAHHLLAALDSHTLASFNNDELVDYRSRRPSVTLDEGRLSEFTELELDMRVLRDNSGHAFLLLSGPEPDFRWESFTQAVADLADKYQVSQAIALYGSPMQVPHTRPMMVLAHGNSSELIGTMATWDNRVIVPGSAALHIERKLYERGLKVAGFTAQVPHYLSQSPYPLAILQLLTAVEESTGLKLPLRTLERDAERVAEQLSQHIGSNPEIMQIVQALEQHYDTEMARYRQEHPHTTLPGESSIPSSDELGAEFEAFLASIDDAATGSSEGGFPQLGNGEKEEGEPEA